MDRIPRHPLRLPEKTYTDDAFGSHRASRCIGGVEAGMSGNGVSGNGSSRSGTGIGARDDAVLLDRQYVWPGDLTEIPDWVYTDEGIYRREVERIFHGRTWNYVALEAEIPNAGDFIRSNVGPTPVVVARTRDGTISAVENRCVHRAAEFCREL